MSASIFKDVDFHPKTNNTEHRTSEISESDLIVRRGQAFTVTLTLNQPLNGEPLIITAYTGQHASEDRGTLSVFSLSESVSRSPTAKAVWRVALDGSSSPAEGILKLAILPPPETPIGEWNLMVKHRDQDRHLATLTVLFNPWCTDDAVFLDDEDQRQEYVMNEQGIIYKGSGNYISPRPWDFGQFEENMTKICLKILDVNVKHEADPADDDSARCNVVYVSRVVSAMINSRDDRGVILGRWSDSFWGGTPPNHWSGSHEILNKWFRSDCRPVRYGQCWVFAGVMCSVLRLLGIPCRPVTNYQSAHDSNKNMIVDVYHANYGVREKRTKDSVWNYHVWVEAWMKRPDLAEDGSYDGWQVLDPTPQEKSNGVYCLGPASVKAILNGKVDLTYDTPFVYAEVNADCIDWMVNKDGSETQFLSDTKRIGQSISTKTVGTRKRLNITDSYKHKEGTDEERTVFEYALSRDYSEADGSEDTDEEEEEEEENEPAENGENKPVVNGGREGTNGSDGENVNAVVNGEREVPGENGAIEGTVGNEENKPVVNGERETGENGEREETEGLDGEREAPDINGENKPVGNGGVVAVENTETFGTSGPTDVNPGNASTPNEPTTDDPHLKLRFKEISKPRNGKDVRLKLVLLSHRRGNRPVSININVQAMTYNGGSFQLIQHETTEKTLPFGKDVSVPIVVPFSAYSKAMLHSDSMKVSAIVTDTDIPNGTYLAEGDIVLLDPPISVSVSGDVRVGVETMGQLVFMNPVQEKLQKCTLTLSGSGLWREPVEYQISDLKPNTRIIIKFPILPYKAGWKTLMADFDCSLFRDITCSCTFKVMH